MPPPVQIGGRIDPARARPVPFCRHGLVPPPRTRARVRVAAEPWRRALSSARTASCTNASLNRAPKASASSSTPAPDLLTQGALAIRAHLHRAAARPRDRPAHEQQVVIGDDLDDLQPTLGDAPAAHAAGALTPLNTREGVAEAPIEPGARTLCEPWLAGPREKLWRLIVPWKPLPFDAPEASTDWPGSQASTVT